MMLQKHVSIHIVILFLLGAIFVNSTSFLKAKINKKGDYTLYKTAIIILCPPEVPFNKEIIEGFINDPEWYPQRSETNTSGLSESQIVLLTNSSHSNSCQELNTLQQESISATSPNGEKRYDLTYYKAGDFYFVVSSLHQPDDPDKIVVGLSAIIIYDQDLHKIAGYSF